MPTVSQLQTDFRGGEWSPYAQGRVDDPRHKTALNLSRNGFPLSRGPWGRRFGTQLCGATRQGQLGRTLQFNFTDLGEYRIELTPGKARVYFGSVLVHDDLSVITNISTATPAVMTISKNATWQTGDAIEVGLVNNGDASVSSYLLGRRYTLTKIAANQYSLVDEVTGAPVNGALVNFNSALATATAQHILELVSPYVNNDWQAVRIIPAANVNPDGTAVAILLHIGYPIQIVTATLPLTGDSNQSFTLTAPTIIDGPYFDPPIRAQYPNGGTLTVTAGAGNDINIVASDATAVGPLGFVASDVGRSMRLYCEPPLWDPAQTYAATSQVKYNGAYYVENGAVAGVTPGTTTTWLPLASTVATFFVWGTIKSVADSTHCVLTAQKFPDGYLQLTFVPVTRALWINQPVITDWRMGLFSPSTGYAACGCYFQGRLGLSGSKGNRVDFSYSNQLFVFSTTDEFANVGAANAIAETFDSDNTNTIFFMQPTSTGVICGTKVGEWLVYGPGTGILASNNIKADRNTSIGCANVQPAVCPLTTVILHKYQEELYEYFPDIFSGKLTAPVLNDNALHMMVTKVQEIAYMSEPEPTIWGRNGDGSFFGCTYRRSSLYGSQPPDYNGFHLHSLGDNHKVMSLTVGPSPDTTRDALYLTTQDPNTMHNYVVLSRPLLQEASTLLNYWGVDTGTVPYGAKLATVNGVQGVQFYGLNAHDINDVLTAMVGGLDCGDYQYLSTGSIFVPFNSDPQGNFTLAYLQSISNATLYGDMAVTLDGTTTTFPAVFGFTFTSTGQELRSSASVDTGITQGPSIGTTRRDHMFGALIAAGVTGTVSVGTDLTNLRVMNFVDAGNNPLSTKNLYLNTVWQDTEEDDYDFNSLFAWQMTRPLPFVVASFGNFTHGWGR